MGRRCKNKRNTVTKIYVIGKTELENDKKKKILKLIGSVVVSLVSVAASIATCFTLWEMRNERNQSYKPYFVIESAEYIDTYTEPMLNKQNTQNLIDSFSKYNGERPEMYINISNIGAGTATNVVIRFTDEVFLDYWKIACKYYDNVEIDNTSIKFEVEDNSDDGTQKVIHSIINDDLDVYKAYIVSGDSVDIKLPEEYQILLHSIVYCTGAGEKLPKIEFTIDYDDLQGVHYTDTYKLSIDIVFCNYLNEGREFLKYVIEPCK